MVGNTKVKIDMITFLNIYNMVKEYQENRYLDYDALQHYINDIAPDILSKYDKLVKRQEYTQSLIKKHDMECQA